LKALKIRSLGELLINFAKAIGLTFAMLLARAEEVIE
jgi:hypothetical protein